MDTFPPLPGPPPPPVGSIEPSPPPEPKHGGRRALLALGILIAVGAIVVSVIVWAAAPGRCDTATFTSSRFGYCLQAPTGWAGDRATVGKISVDELTLKEAPTTVFIQAVALSQGQSLDDFTTYVRSLDEKAGYQLTDITQFTVDGVQAAQWDVTTKGGGAVTTSGSSKMREVVFAKDGTAWRVQLGDTKKGFAAHVTDLQQMLDTWHFL